ELSTMITSPETPAVSSPVQHQSTNSPIVVCSFRAGTTMLISGTESPYRSPPGTRNSTRVGEPAIRSTMDIPFNRHSPDSGPCERDLRLPRGASQRNSIATASIRWRTAAWPASQRGNLLHHEADGAAAGTPIFIIALSQIY